MSRVMTCRSTRISVCSAVRDQTSPMVGHQIAKPSPLTFDFSKLS
jgi:hypothetical protein